jgi:hypothetical protein
VSAASTHGRQASTRPCGPSSEPHSELACGSISAEGFDRIVSPATMIGPF